MTTTQHDNDRPRCRWDRTTGTRLTRDHLDTCDATSCRGCKPCPGPHCAMCGREHTTLANPVTCPTCLARVDDDLADITWSYAALPEEATDAARDGRLAAAAPIPGGHAQVLRGPTSSRYRRTHTVLPSPDLDHHEDDPVPPLSVLAYWEDLWRAHLDQPAPDDQWVEVPTAAAYLRRQLHHMAQQHGPGIPDFSDFTRHIRATRAGLERALHDERVPQRGVECFECGERLERRWRDPRPCTHSTPARQLVRRARKWARFGYPELGPTTPELRAAARPCGDCNQGGLDNPSAGVAWECPGCRKEYSPGEYATAVRRDLLENGADGDGWTHVSMAAEAASTMTGHHIPAGTVRKWVDRGKVASRVGDIGMRLVYWPDVAEEASAAVERARAAAAERRRKADLEARLWDAVVAGERPREAGRRLGLSRVRVRELSMQWAEQGRLAFKRAPDLGWAIVS